MLHVLGLPSGKDIQRPAPFLPANSQLVRAGRGGHDAVRGDIGKCGGAPSAVWAIDLDSDAKPVVSWKTNGGGVVGAVAFTPDGTLIAAIGAGQTTGDGKANAIVALDPKTLQLKDWFSQPTAEFVTGPTILRHNNKEHRCRGDERRPHPAAGCRRRSAAPNHATPLCARSRARRGRNGGRRRAGGMAGVGARQGAVRRA